MARRGRRSTARRGRTAVRRASNPARRSRKKKPSPYNKFVKKMSPILRRQNPGIAQPEIMKLIGKEWKRSHVSMGGMKPMKSGRTMKGMNKVLKKKVKEKKEAQAKAEAAAVCNAAGAFSDDSDDSGFTPTLSPPDRQRPVPYHFQLQRSFSQPNIPFDTATMGNVRTWGRGPTSRPVGESSPATDAVMDAEMTLIANRAAAMDAATDRVLAAATDRALDAATDRALAAATDRALDAATDRALAAAIDRALAQLQAYPMTPICK